MIPEKGWKDMEVAPKDGTIIYVKYRAFGATRGTAIQVQASQWGCDGDGRHWAWRKPWHMGTTTYADGWMTYAEFQAAQADEEAGMTSSMAFDL